MPTVHPFSVRDVSTQCLLSNAAVLFGAPARFIGIAQPRRGFVFHTDSEHRDRILAFDEPQQRAVHGQHPLSRRRRCQSFG